MANKNRQPIGYLDSFKLRAKHFCFFFFVIYFFFFLCACGIDNWLMSGNKPVQLPNPPPLPPLLATPLQHLLPTCTCCREWRGRTGGKCLLSRGWFNGHLMIGFVHFPLSLSLFPSLSRSLSFSLSFSGTKHFDLLLLLQLHGQLDFIRMS